MQQDRHDAAAATASDADSAAAVVLRVVQLLEWQEVKSGRRCAAETGAGGLGAAPPVSLGVLARDKGLQKHLGCRPLLPLLQAQCAQLLAQTEGGDSGTQWASMRRLRLVDESARGWCAQLVPPPYTYSYPFTMCNIYM